MVTGLGLLRNGLYYYEPTNFPTALSASAETWHFRLGHPSSTVATIPVSATQFQKCSVCPLAKQSRLPFVPSDNKSSALFQLIHCDIWGPYSTASHSGCYYFLSLVDDFSRTTWVYLMKHKSEVFQFFSHFLNMVKTQFTASVLCIRSDNGSEFLSNSMQHLLHTLGITHQLTCPYTPQQNGVVERKHRHLIQVARALRFQANLPLQFGGNVSLQLVT